METSVEFKTQQALNLYQLNFLTDYSKKLRKAIEKNLDHLASLHGAIAELNYEIDHSKNDQINEVVFSLHPFDPKPFKSYNDVIKFLELKRLGKKINIRITKYDLALKARESVANEFYKSTLLGDMLKDELDIIDRLIRNLEQDNKLFQSQAEFYDKFYNTLDYTKLSWDKFNTFRTPNLTEPIDPLLSENQKKKRVFRHLKPIENSELKDALKRFVVTVKDKTEKLAKDLDKNLQCVYLVKDTVSESDINRICTLMINEGLKPNPESIKTVLRLLGYKKQKNY